MTTGETNEWVACGRRFSAQEIGDIRQTVAWLPGLARKELAATLCEHLHWHTAAGTPKIQACQRLLERLAGAGLVALPPVRDEQRHGGPGATVSLSGRSAPGQPVTGPLRNFQPVRLEPVTGAAETGLWNEYVERFHPLGYRGAFGYRLRYFIRAGGEPLGCVLLAGAARALTVRDRWIGWSAPVRQRNLPWVINNSRFLIFPHVRIPHLASHVLGQLARRVREDWQCQWGFAPLLLETFVDPARFAGTCYRAAGWQLLGETTGHGLARPGKSYQSTPRLVLVKPLHGHFRRLLCSAPLPGREVQ
jgi:hypothetical protein